MENFSEQLQKISNLIKSEKPIDALKIFSEILNASPPPPISEVWYRSFYLLQMIYFSIDQKSGIEYDFLRQCILRGFFLGMQRDLIPTKVAELAADILHRVEEKSIESEMKNRLSLFLFYAIESSFSRDDWNSARALIAKARLTECYDEKINALCEKYADIGKNMLEKITVDNIDYLCMFCPAGLGDTVIAAKLSYAVQNRIGKSKTCLIVREGYYSAGNFCENVQKVIKISDADFRKITFYAISKQLNFADNWAIGGVLLDPYHDQARFQVNLSLLDNFKFILKLPLDTKPSPIIMQNLSDSSLENLLRKYKINPDRAVILFPYANSVHIPGCTPEFWSDLVEKLKSLGFEIYTNCAPNQKELDRTTKLDVNLQEIFYLSEKVRYCIGIRSGMLDLLANSNCNLISLCLDYHMNFVFDLSNDYPRPNLKTIYWRYSMKFGDLQNEIINALKNF